MLKLKLLLPLGFMVMTSYASQTPLFNIPNPSQPSLTEAELMNSVAANTKISFIVWLKLRNQEALEKLVEDIYNPDSPRYQQFLTPELYEQEFAPSKDVEQNIVQFFIDQGMQAKVLRHSIRVTGTVKQIAKTLHVEINDYRYQHTIGYANASPPRIESKLAKHIADITGLSNLSNFTSDLSTDEENRDIIPQDLKFIWNHFIPTANPTDISLKGFTGAQLQKTYNLNNIPRIQGQRLDGSGQTLVIVDQCGTNGPKKILRDANKYFQMNGIPPFIPEGPAKNFAIVHPDGSPFTHCPSASGFSREIVLDVESSHTVAPGDKTALVLGADQRSTLMDLITHLIHSNYTIAGFRNAYVISNSWSSPENDDPPLESTLRLAAAAGISVNFSSGDCGDNTYTNAKKCHGTWPAAPRVNYPSSSAYVTAVGATAMFVNPDYRYAFETVWGTVETRRGSLVYTGGTGGGISQFYGPVSWQNSIHNFTAGGYGVIQNFGNLRALPDIAMLGDPLTGLLIIANGAEVKDGGTSLACPLFSATLVLVNQARHLLQKPPIGHAAPYLYRQNHLLLANRAINLIIPPAMIISGATPPPSLLIHNTPAPASSFTMNNVTFGWDSSLTLEPESQFWNDGVGVGSPNLPHFVMTMADL